MYITYINFQKNQNIIEKYNSLTLPSELYIFFYYFFILVYFLKESCQAHPHVNVVCYNISEHIRKRDIIYKWKKLAQT